MTETVLDYPAWLRIDHWLNILFLTLLLRSGIEILCRVSTQTARDAIIGKG